MIISPREARSEVNRVLKAWAAYENDSKTMRKSLGYKSPLGKDYKRVNGRNTGYSEYFDYDKEFLEHIGKVIESLQNRDSKRLIYYAYQDHPNLDWVNWRDPEHVQLANEFKLKYYQSKSERWSRETGRPKGAYNMALSRLKDDLYWPIFKFI